MSVPPVRVLVATAGNEFMLDIAATVVDGMRAAGATCELAIDQPPLAQGRVLQVVVAPHEYFPLFLERTRGTDGPEAAASTYVLNVEQPGSPWFERAWLYAKSSLGVFDIDPEGAAEFTRRGLAAIHTPLGVPSRSAGLAPRLDRRPIDIVFLGHASPRREQFFADNAQAFSRRACRLLFVDVTRPRRAETPGYVSGATRSQLLGSCKVLLNVHSSERQYFERHRALLGFTHGCAVVSETSAGTAPLVDGTHLVMAPLHELAAVCLRLLDDPERLAAVATAGWQMATEQLSMVDSCRAMLAHATTCPPRGQPVHDDEQRRLDVRRRLRDSLAARLAGHPDWTVRDNRSWTAGTPARVSVIVTVFDYARYLEECVASVVTADPVHGGVELVIVDDASSDGSLDLAHALADAAPIPVRVVGKHRNTGLADARNLGSQLARGAFVLTLDADNWIYPSCIARLAETLDDGDAAAAYPMLRRFHDGTGAPAGLASQYAWSPRDLVRGPYIDALALFRRDVLVAVGGYSTELIDHGWFGWEDYDLWLKLAQAGAACRHVPMVLASYRVHDQSMLGRTNRTTEGIARHLASKFAALAAAHPAQEAYFGFPATGASASGPGAHPGDDSPLLEARCRDLEAEVRAFRASWSWRMTAPLRFAYRQLGLTSRRVR